MDKGPIKGVNSTLLSQQILKYKAGDNLQKQTVDIKRYWEEVMLESMIGQRWWYCCNYLIENSGRLKSGFLREMENLAQDQKSDYAENLWVLQSEGLKCLCRESEVRGLSVYLRIRMTRTDDFIFSSWGILTSLCTKASLWFWERLINEKETIKEYSRDGEMGKCKHPHPLEFKRKSQGVSALTFTLLSFIPISESSRKKLYLKERFFSRLAEIHPLEFLPCNSKNRRRIFTESQRRPPFISRGPQGATKIFFVIFYHSSSCGVSIHFIINCDELPFTGQIYISQLPCSQGLKYVQTLHVSAYAIPAPIILLFLLWYFENCQCPRRSRNLGLGSVDLGYFAVFWILWSISKADSNLTIFIHNIYHFFIIIKLFIHFDQNCYIYSGMPLGGSGEAMRGFRGIEASLIDPCSFITSEVFFKK
ncbi:hypothetical protein VP01_3978g1 [Puccinia sorghi]|uniref:Uncharacterized protein n=1 Tax=Puccinia sorghi TaxID=27349 RepID=A0A0L6UU62_9BASI|nr:hypothetical protein VP01_3978g1 [Puccinia sorghi]